MTTILDNTGSIARDHLANERTFLAWLRTGVTLMGVGVALVKFGEPVSGLFLTIIGIFFLGTSLYRYFEVKNGLLEDKYIINTFCIVLITILAILFIFLAFFVILLEKYMLN